MRTVRSLLAGTMTLALLGGLGGAVVAQDVGTELDGVKVTVAQQCAGRSICPWAASDPRLPDTLQHKWTGDVDVEGEEELGAGFTWMDVWTEGPEGGWTGHVYALWGDPTHNFLVLSGTGANEGWQYVASGIDPNTDGDFEWVGTLYEGELPPYPTTGE
jgi:hypothetical protein